MCKLILSEASGARPGGGAGQGVPSVPGALYVFLCSPGLFVSLCLNDNMPWFTLWKLIINELY